MNLLITHSLAINAFKQEAVLAQEQKDYLRLLQGYTHVVELSEAQLVRLLEQIQKLQKMNPYAQTGRYLPMLLTCLRVALEERLASLRRKS